MRIDIITVLPEMIEGFFNYSIMSRAQKKGIAEIHIHNLRDYAYDRYRKVDDYPFGGCAGMVMKIEPIDRCISALKAERQYDEVIFTTPDGEQFNQKMANTLSLSQNLIILCGHFKGIDYTVAEPDYSVRTLQGHRLPHSRAFHHDGNQYRRLCAVGRRACRAGAHRCLRAADPRRRRQ